MTDPAKDVVERARARKWRRDFSDPMFEQGHQSEHDLVQELCDEITRLRSLEHRGDDGAGWRDISTAPKSGSVVVDLWFAGDEPHRVPDCVWAPEAMRDKGAWVQPSDGTVIAPEGAPFIQPTHWMIPAPPGFPRNSGPSIQSQFDTDVERAIANATTEGAPAISKLAHLALNDPQILADLQAQLASVRAEERGRKGGNERERRRVRASP